MASIIWIKYNVLNNFKLLFNSKIFQVKEAKALETTVYLDNNDDVNIDSIYAFVD